MWVPKNSQDRQFAKNCKKKLEKLALVHYTFERHKHTVQSTKSYKMSRSISDSDILEVTNF